MSRGRIASCCIPAASSESKAETQEVVEIRPDSIRVTTTARGGRTVALRRMGQGWPVSFEVAQSLAELTRSAESLSNDFEPVLWDWVSAWVGRFARVDLDNQITVEPAEPEFHTFLGGLGNRIVSETLRQQGKASQPLDFTIRTGSRSGFADLGLENVSSKLAGIAPALALSGPHECPLRDARARAASGRDRERRRRRGRDGAHTAPTEHGSRRT